jgi:transposase InsO family protein
VLALRQAHPAWGGRKLHHRLRALGVAAVPAPSTISKILGRHGLIDSEQWAQSRATQRFERATPNELWQMDFKGEWKTEDGRWCYPLTMLDDCSRYNLLLAACGNQKRVTVRGHLEAAFQRYGLPQAMLLDNGTPWSISHVPGGWTKLTAWLLRLDVKVLHGRPYHPQTQGKEERFHRTLRVELLQGRRHEDHPAVQRDFDRWRVIYNHQRPHEALGMATPASRYTPSRRAYRWPLPSIEYGPLDQVRQVNAVGQLSFDGKVYKISEAFAGQPVALRPTAVDGGWEVYYCRQRTAVIDQHTGRAVSCRASGRCAPSSPTALAQQPQECYLSV